MPATTAHRAARKPAAEPTTHVRKETWRATFAVDLARAIQAAGVDATGLEHEDADLDRTWGDKVGMVFYGASPEVNERAARFFYAWACRHLRLAGVVGGYQTQEAISYFGRVLGPKYASGNAGGWHAPHAFRTPPVVGESNCVEVREGIATSYIYYPGAE